MAGKLRPVLALENLPSGRVDIGQERKSLVLQLRPFEHFVAMRGPGNGVADFVRQDGNARPARSEDDGPVDSGFGGKHSDCSETGRLRGRGKTKLPHQGINV